MIARVERMYTESEENRFLEVTYANGDQVTYANGNKEVLYSRFNSFGWLHGLNRVLISTFASICSGWSPPRRGCSGWSPPRRRLFQAKPEVSEGASVAAPAVLAIAGWAASVVDAQFAFGLLVHPVLGVMVTRLLG